MKTLAQTAPLGADLVTYAEGRHRSATPFATRAAWYSRGRSWGLPAYWVAEHHNLDGIASAATVVTDGIISPRPRSRSASAPAASCAQPRALHRRRRQWWATLESIYTGRIDLGLGARARPTEPLTMRALRRDSTGRGLRRQRGGADVVPGPFRTRPGGEGHSRCGKRYPDWILGSSTYSAHTRRAIGRPYAFASHFAPAS